MLFFDFDLPTIAENLAIDEAWLDMAEEGQWAEEALRIWQAETPFAVIGRGSHIAQEVNLAAAEAAHIPIFRRMSGGAAVVAGPGCMMYTLLLSYQQRPYLRNLDQAHQLVMDQMVTALEPLVPGIAWDGTCDVVVNARKVSGNSLRCRRDWLVYHGTLLLNMDLGLIDQFLLHPPREPEYRQKRQHSDFVANLELDAESVKARLREVWAAEPTPPRLPTERIARLVSERYLNRPWIFQR